MDRHPREGPLASLPRHVACALRRERLERKRTGHTPRPVKVSLVPSAFSSMQARLAHLEEQNRKLRLELRRQRRVSHAGPPNDTEAFLKYLEVFQAQARALVTESEA